MSFDFLGLSDHLLNAIKDAGYSEPTPIQKQVIPSILMGRDVLGIAQTGTGKTAGFTCPMIDILSEGKAKARIPRSLIIEPTRELAVQIQESFEKYGKNHKLSCALLIGGTSMEDQIKALNKSVDVLIATPGRLLDHFERGNVMLNGIEILVIDEADRMLDMGFIPDVERIRKLIIGKPQTLFFSATMPPEIKKLTKAFLDDPKTIHVDAPPTAAETVEQRFIETSPQGKNGILKKLLRHRDVTSAIIFCNTKKTVSAVFKELKRDHFNAHELHGDMDQSNRLKVLNGFKSGEIEFLIASDVAARGLDIKDVSHIINYDVPNKVEDYIHRIGRTGRAGKKGHAVVLVTKRQAHEFDKIKRIAKVEIKPFLFDDGAAQKQPQQKPTQAQKPQQQKPQAQKPQAQKPQAQKSQAQKPQQQKPQAQKPQQQKPQAQKPQAQKPQAQKPKTQKPRHGNFEIQEMEEAKIGMGDHVPAFLRQPIPSVKR